MELPPAVVNLEKRLAVGKDSALLRFSLGSEYLKIGRFDDAAAHLERAVSDDPRYSAAWKLLGKARLGANDPQAARAAWTQGIKVAEARGDVQAAKEMTVFLKRLDKQHQRP